MRFCYHLYPNYRLTILLPAIIASIKMVRDIDKQHEKGLERGKRLYQEEHAE